jgi:glycosyltransferase involved in cell wall biosynthesis
MGRAITNLLGGEDRRRQMGDAARARAIENFNQETKADEYLAWLKDIVERLGR